MEQSGQSPEVGPAASRIRKAVRLSGRVQGVIFRQSARRQALALGITGFARNNTDGSLTIVAEGREPALEEFIRWCRTGSLLARVDALEFEAVPEAEKPFTDFEMQ